MQPTPHTIAVLLAPMPALLLLALLFAGEPEQSRELRNAGYVLNGVHTAERVDLAVERALAKHPRVIVIGNSNANTDVDRATLGAGLGLPAEEVAALTIPNSSAAHWVAILRRAQRAGVRPLRVIVVSRLQLVLVRRPISEGARRSLFALLSPSDEDLRRAAAWGPDGLERVRERREWLRTRLLRGLRGWLPKLLGLPPPEPAMRRALSDDRTDLGRLARPTPPSLPDAARSFLPALVAAAGQLGARLTLVRPPPPPLLGPEQGDDVSEEQILGARRVVSEGGGALLDLSGIEIPARLYRNPDHLDPEGARRLTGALVAALKPARGPRVGALGEIRVSSGVVARERGLARYLSPPPPLPPLGEVRWDASGGSIALIERRWPDDDWTRTATRLGVRCSPLRIAVSGRPLESVPCEDVAAQPQSACHAPGVLLFHADPGPVTVTLDVERACDGARWLYPGDEVEIRWPDSQALSRPLDRLEIDIAAPLPAEVHAALEVGGRTIASGLVPRGVGAVLSLGGIAPSVPPILRLVNRGEAAVLATRAEIVAVSAP